MLEISMFLDEEDMYQGKRLDEYIMRYLMHHGILGASVFPATMGYGHKHHLHHARQLGTADERPLMIVFVDEESKVWPLLAHLKEVLQGGLIIAHAVERI